MIDLNEMKSYDCQFPDPFILVVSNTPKFIDSIRIDRFNLIVSSYLEISSITWKPRKKKFKLICLFHWWVTNMERKLRGSSVQSICSLGMKDLRFQPLTRGRVCFRWRGLMQDRIFKLISVFCYILYFYAIFVILDLWHFFPCF